MQWRGILALIYWGVRDCWIIGHVNCLLVGVTFIFIFYRFTIYSNSPFLRRLGLMQFASNSHQYLGRIESVAAFTVYDFLSFLRELSHLQR